MGPHSAQTGSGVAGMVGLICGAAASTVTVGAAALVLLVFVVARSDDPADDTAYDEGRRSHTSNVANIPR